LKPSLRAQRSNRSFARQRSKPDCFVAFALRAMADRSLLKRDAFRLIRHDSSPSPACGGWGPSPRIRTRGQSPSPGSHLRCDPTSPRKRGEVRKPSAPSQIRHALGSSHLVRQRAQSKPSSPGLTGRSSTPRLLDSMLVCVEYRVARSFARRRASRFCRAMTAVLVSSARVGPEAGTEFAMTVVWRGETA
jgi:hypothetical protein